MRETPSLSPHLSGCHEVGGSPAVLQLEEELVETPEPGGQTDCSHLHLQPQPQLLTGGNVREAREVPGLSSLPHQQDPVVPVPGPHLALPLSLLHCPHQQVLSHQAVLPGGGGGGGGRRRGGGRGGRGGGGG